MTIRALTLLLLGIVGAGCSGAETKTLPKTCPAEYIKIGTTCLDRSSGAAVPYLEAHKTCNRRGGALATVNVLKRAMKNRPELFPREQKSYWAAHKLDIFVVQPAAIQEPDDKTPGNDEQPDAEPISGAKKYSVSHHYRCEKSLAPRNTAGDSNTDTILQCGQCMEDSAPCFAALEILNCLYILNR